jgi:hypothetical protein
MTSKKSDSSLQTAVTTGDGSSSVQTQPPPPFASSEGEANAMSSVPSVKRERLQVSIPLGSQPSTSGNGAKPTVTSGRSIHRSTLAVTLNFAVRLLERVGLVEVYSENEANGVANAYIIRLQADKWEFADFGFVLKESEK